MFLKSVSYSSIFEFFYEFLIDNLIEEEKRGTILSGNCDRRVSLILISDSTLTGSDIDSLIRFHEYIFCCPIHKNRTYFLSVEKNLFRKGTNQ